MPILRFASLSLVSLVVALTTAWSALALWFQLPAPMWLKVLAALLCTGFGVSTIVLLWRRRAARAMVAYGAGFAGLLSWWASIVPMENRDWADDVARHLRFETRGDLVTLHNVRNFDWRSNTVYTPRWETREVDLGRLRSVDVAASYWMGPAIAHTLVSFGFDDGRFLTFSIEIRKERGEEFSAIGGFFKRFETSLVLAEENDILRVRSNVRGEDVYLYRVRLDKSAMQSMFLAYLREAARLDRAPEFYNTLTSNCTTIVYSLARQVVPGLPLDWRLLASGYLPEYLHDVGGLMPGHDMKTLREAGRITVRAREYTGKEEMEFSRIIRVGMPGVIP